MHALRPCQQLLFRSTAGAIISKPITSRTAFSAHLIAQRPLRHSSTAQSQSAISTPTSKEAKSPDVDLSNVQFSASQVPSLPSRLTTLLTNTPWTLTPSHNGLFRTYTFPSFTSAWRFMNLVADECKKARHHPEWRNCYNEVTVEWTTHKPAGLSMKDVEMAEFCEETALGVGLKGQKENDGNK